ncbi:MAG TPA: DUF3618 domain-containing protein [Gemmatimonadaceae bacterium]|nr:DUF3618 domain-containing protein [Gemmatimonadaceae bacterium]
MGDRITEVRADIEETRARMATAIAELEQKANVAEKVREHPWASLGIAFVAGVALSRSRDDAKAPHAAVEATSPTRTKLGSAFDQIVTAAIGGVVGALHSKVDDVVSGVVRSVKSDPVARPVGTATDGRATEVPIRAD